MRFPHIILLAATALILVGCREPQPSIRAHYVPTEAERAAWPKTVDEAVTSILADMKDADRTRIRDTKKEDLISFHHGWGTGIRDEFGLWRGNTNLMTACHADHPDDASMVIIEAVWQKLQKP
jgi:hypothetical protein